MICLSGAFRGLGFDSPVAETLIKVCRLRSPQTLKELASLGVGFAGVHAINSLDISTIAQARSLADFRKAEGIPVELVLLTKVKENQRILSALKATGINWLQLHVPWTTEELAQLRLTAQEYEVDIRVIQMVDPQVPSTIPFDSLLNFAEYLLLDNSIGGTGRPLSVEHLNRATKCVTRSRLFIAGGLTPTNVSSVIQTYRPFGVDIQSGVMDDTGAHDVNKLRAFVEAVRLAESHQA